VAEVVQIRGKTEQRVTAVISVLKDATEDLTYGELTSLTNTPYDQLLYILATLVEVGFVERTEALEDRPGRPRVQFKWVKQGGARALGVRKL
jgi:hypothetical protein